MINLKYTFSSVALIAILFSACGGNGDSTSNSGGTTPDPNTNNPTTATLVDPYIIGAILCEDKNKNATCDTGEQLSSATTSNGSFTFDNNLTAGSHIIIKTQGSHEGVTYDLNISGLVDANGSIAVVSPLTTFQTKGLSTTQIAAILNEAAINENITLDDNTTRWAISANKIGLNPLANSLLDKKIGVLTDSDLTTIQASLATYGILKIMNGSTTLRELNATALYASGMNQNGHSEVHDITKAVLSNITSTLSLKMLRDIKSSIDQGRSSLATGIAQHPSFNATSAQTKATQSMPEPSIQIPVKVAVSIIDRLAQVGYEKCNSTSGTPAQKVSAALLDVSGKLATLTNNAIKLGTQLYGLVYQSNLSGLNISGHNYINDLPADIQAGITAKTNNKSTIRFNASDGLEAK